MHSENDCHALIHAARHGIVQRVIGRLTDAEKKRIQPGELYVFNETESGIRRWTDRKVWTPSRVQGIFLLYKDLSGTMVKKTYSCMFEDGKYHLVIYGLQEWEENGECCAIFREDVERVKEQVNKRGLMWAMQPKKWYLAGDPRSALLHEDYSIQPGVHEYTERPSSPMARRQSFEDAQSANGRCASCGCISQNLLMADGRGMPGNYAHQGNETREALHATKQFEQKYFSSSQNYTDRFNVPSNNQPKTNRSQSMQESSGHHDFLPRMIDERQVAQGSPEDFNIYLNSILSIGDGRRDSCAQSESTIDQSFLTDPLYDFNIDNVNLDSKYVSNK